MKVVLFDVDGTLVNVKGAGRWALTTAIERTFDKKGLMESAASVVFDGRTDPLIIADIAASADLAGEDLQSRRVEIEETYLDLLESRLQATGPHAPLPGVVELISALPAPGITSGLLTGNTQRGAGLKLAAAGLGETFKIGAFGSDGHDRAALGRLARERFEEEQGRPIRATEIVVVGDSVEDVRAARANGYRCLGVGTGWTSLELLREKGADLVVPDLSDTSAMVQWIAG